MSDIVAVLEHYEMVGALVKTYLAVGDPDLKIRGGGRSSRPSDKGRGAVLKQIFFGPSGLSLV